MTDDPSSPPSAPGARSGAAKLARRGIDSSALTTALALAPVLPVSAIGFALLAALLDGVFGIPPGVSLAGLVGFAVAPLVPPLTPLLARSLRLRPPTSAELALIEPHWKAVLARSGRPSPGRYRLYVEEGDHLNAYAAGGWLVGVTGGALQLPADELEATLAHELGHHLGGHLLASTLRQLVFAPVRFLSVALWLTGRVVHAINVGSWFFALPVVNWISFVLSLVLRGIAAVLGGLVRLAFMLGTLAGRRSELLADDVAVTLGYGEALRRSFVRLQASGEDTDLAGLSAVQRAMFQTHPAIKQRIARIDAHRRLDG